MSTTIRAFGWLRAAAATAILLTGATRALAAPTPAGPIVEDARSHLKAGLYDEGQAAMGMTLVSETRSPQGVYDPLHPPKIPVRTGYEHEAEENDGKPKPPPKPAEPGPKLDMGSIGLGNSDMAFAPGLLIQGDFHGFNVFDIADRDHPKVLASVVCPGGQGDVSVWGKLVFMSVEQNLARTDCGTAAAEGKVNAVRFRGLRVFDISDPSTPRQIAAVQTCRGSHTHTLVPDPRDPNTLYIYNSGTAPVRPAQELAGCSDGEPEQNPKTSRYSIDVIKVPLDNPADAAVVSSPRVFADPRTGAINGLWKGGNHGPGTQTTMGKTDLCHDITAYPAIGLAAGACSGDGILLDISDPPHPRRVAAIEDPNFAFWHSATFSNDATKVIFTDEWGSGLAPRCRGTDNPDWGGDVVLSLKDRRMAPLAYYKLPSAQPANSNCVAHNGGLIPVPGRDILVQAWYGGGISVMDFTDGAHPREIAYFTHGPVSPDRRVVAGYWAAYWHDGRVYGSEIDRGLDVLKLEPSADLSADEIAAAESMREGELNVQTQGRIVWPETAVVGRAYLDQLGREGQVDSGLEGRVRAALGLLALQGRHAPGLAARLDGLAARAQGRDVLRWRGIAAILREGVSGPLAD